MFLSVMRRELLYCWIIMGAGLLSHSHSYAESADPQIVTHTYKTIGDLEIQADVYVSQEKLLRPAVVWIHGGALIIGHRAGVNDRLKDHVLSAGYVLISLDYRLAPETKLPEIIRDIEDAFTWIHQDGVKLFNIDPTRIAVAGGSAGGYLTLTAGFRVHPRPTVLFSLYGYGDLVGDWYSRPSPHSRHHSSKMTREEAYDQVSGPVIADSRNREGDGAGFYRYCRQTGTWPLAVSGWDPIQDPENFFPYMAVKNVTAEYPPTIMIHGTSDTDVPHELSATMAEQLKQHGVLHELISILDGEHGLDGGDPDLIDAAYAKAFAFIDQHLTSR